MDGPGVGRLVEGDRFTVGEPSGGKTERVTALSDAFRAAGFKAPVRPRIRDEIWVKLWGNLSRNSVSALTGATLAEICRFPGTRGLISTRMQEGQEIGAALGATLAIGVDKRERGTQGGVAGGRRVGKRG